MKIDTIQELKAVVDLCRKSGVVNIEIDNVKLLLGEPPPKRSYMKSSALTEEAQLRSPTEEEMLLWSVRDQELTRA
jgi:hypothetical protein